MILMIDDKKDAEKCQIKVNLLTPARRRPPLFVIQ